MRYKPLSFTLLLRKTRTGWSMTVRVQFFA